MHVKGLVKDTLNALLRPAGVTLVTQRSYDAMTRKYHDLLHEIQGAFAEVILPDLPVTEQRVGLLAQLQGTNVSEALYLVRWLHQSLVLAGDVCEFGVAQGLTSTLIAHEIAATDKHLWLFDSFAGLPKPSEKDVLIDDIFGLGAMEKYEGLMASGVGEVLSRLRTIDFPRERTKIVHGFIEETVKQPGLPAQVCFAYVDFDFYEPILTALRFLDRCLVPCGVIMIDDYDFFSTGAKTAIEEFLADQDHQHKYDLILPYKFAGHFCILQKKA